MASNGGVATPAMVGEKPVMTLLSGLAAGVLGGAWVGELSGRRKLDHLRHRRHQRRYRHRASTAALPKPMPRSTSIAGFPLLLPMIDIHTIGAGGGSIAYHRSRRRVPRRAAQRRRRARPRRLWPRRRQQPTVTDANLVLGRLDKDDFLGGGMKLDDAAAHRVIEELADASRPRPSSMRPRAC